MGEALLHNSRLRTELTARRQPGRGQAWLQPPSQPGHGTAPWHADTLAVPPRRQGQNGAGSSVHTNNVEHNFCPKSGLTDYSPPPKPQRYPNSLLHRKFNFSKPLRYGNYPKLSCPTAAPVTSQSARNRMKLPSKHSCYSCPSPSSFAFLQKIDFKSLPPNFSFPSLIPFYKRTSRKQSSFLPSSLLPNSSFSIVHLIS